MNKTILKSLLYPFLKPFVGHKQSKTGLGSLGSRLFLVPVFTRFRNCFYTPGTPAWRAES